MRSARTDLIALLIVPALWHPVMGQEEDPPDVRRALENAAVELSVGRPEAALRALNLVESAEPSNPWLAFYRGAARLQLDEPYRAMAELDRAWRFAHAAPKIDATLLARIKRLRRDARRRVLQVSLRLGVAHDSNVAFIGQGALTRGLVADDEDELFESRFTAAFAPLMDSRRSLTFGVAAVHSWHFRIDEFDVQDYTGFVNYEHALGSHTDLSLSVRASAVYLGNESYLNGAGADVAWRYDWPQVGRAIRWLDSTIHAGLTREDFRFLVTAELDQDGWVPSAGVVQRFVIPSATGGPAALIGRFGYVFHRYETDGSEYERDTHRVYCGVEMPLMHPFRPGAYLVLPDKPLWLELTYDWEFARHDNASVLDARGDARRDRTGTYGVRLSQVLLENKHDLVLHLLARYMDADSNIRFTDRSSPFTFDKFVVGVQFEWTW